MKYIKKRGSKFHYIRRVPKEVRDIDNRDFVQVALNTDSPSLAQQRTVALNHKIEAYWQSILLDQHDQEDRFKQTVRAALKPEQVYQRPDNAQPSVEALLQQLLDMQQTNLPKPINATAKPLETKNITISEALERFWTLNKDKLLDKSDGQIRRWENSRTHAVRNLIKVIGDKQLSDITRDDVLDFKDWWVARLTDEGMTANSANKDFIHTRSILMNINDNMRLNLPIIKLFERIAIKDVPRTGRSSFETAFVQDVLLNKNAMSGLNAELQLFICAMADTGARINELAGLEVHSGDISLDGDIPFIHIRPNKTRQLKNPTSERTLPLVGAALYAFQQMPNGFVSYAHRPDTLSSTINKWFRENDTLPSKHHSLYSLRHCFQDRLTQVEAPDRVQAELMGHSFYRPKYGAGSSLAQRHKWMQRIAFKANEVCR